MFAATDPVLTVRELSKSFARGLARALHRTCALRDIELTVARGEVLCVAGDESAGKTTLLQCLAGLLKYECGTVRWSGESLPSGVVPADVIYVPAVPVYYPFLTVRDVVQISADRNTQRRVTCSARETLSMFELDVRIDCHIARLTRAELRALSIAEAMVRNPVAILIDTACADSRSFTGPVRDALRAFGEEGGTVIVAARDPLMIADAATRILMLHEGMIRRSFHWDAVVPAAASAPPLLLAETLH
jgi:cell division transport system ATP-binding protein